MRKVIIAIIVFITLFFIADFIFYIGFKKLVFSKTFSGELGGKVNEYLYHQRNVDFIIMGNSRAKYQINPTKLNNFYNGNGFNIAISGVGGIVYNDILLDVLKQKKRLPKAIILQIDAVAFESENAEKNNGLPDNESFAVNGLLPFYESKMQRFNYYINYIPVQEKWKFCFKSFSFNGKVINLLFNRLGKKEGPNDIKGYVGLNTFLKNEKESKYQEETSDINSRVELRKSKLIALNAFLEVCKDNNIKLITVLSPSYNNVLYRPLYNKQLIKYLEAKKVIVINYANINSMQNISGGIYWKDETHLNDMGASIFSDTLNAVIGRMNSK